MGKIWSEFQKDTLNAAKKIATSWDCFVFKLKWVADNPTQFDKIPPCTYPEEKWNDQVKWLDRLLEATFIILGLLALLLVTWYIFPALGFVNDIFTWLYDVTTYIYRAFAELFTMWGWLWGVTMRFFTQTLAGTVGGSEILWWLMGAELMLLSVVYVLFGIMGIWHELMDTDIEKIFSVLNTPFRWIRINVLQKFFGKILGNILSLIELPLESLMFLISLPLAGLDWVYEKLVEGKNTGG